MKLLIVLVFGFVFSKSKAQVIEPLTVQNCFTKAQKETNRIKLGIGLDSVQYKKVLKINTDYFRKLADISFAKKDNLLLRKQLISQLNIEREDDLKKAIKSNQYAKYKNDKDSLFQRVKLRNK